MSDSNILRIPIISAESQQIDIQWKNLNVYVAMPKRGSQKKVFDVDNDELLLKKYRNSQMQFENEAAVELSKKDTKYDFKCILDNQNGFATSGQITAIMGPSGAGKTTLLACIGQRMSSSKTTVVKGQITANGSDYGSVDFCNFGVFVMQNDLLISTLTVRESLMFSASLRLSRISEEEKQERVDQLIRDLKLTACQHTLVGDVMIKGISGGEKKRTSIGIELIANPPVLILDEPTSGLDSYTAFVIVDILKKIAKKQNRTILFTIHQPSSDIFELFDRLILLHDGKTTYQGQASLMTKYMKDLNMTIPQFQNTCDFFMNELRSGDTQLTNQSYELYLEKDNISEFGGTNFTQGYIKRQNENSFLFEYKTLARRSLTNYKRNPTLLKGRTFITIFFIVFQTCLYWHVGTKRLPIEPPGTSPIGMIQTYVLNLQAALFFVGTGGIFSTMGPLVQLFPIERSIFLKEENSRLYRTQSYFLAKISIEVPFAILTPIFQSSILYYFLGLRQEWSSFFEFLITSIFIAMCGNGIGLFAGCLLSNPQTSAALAPAFVLPLMLFGGQYINLGNLPVWITWLQYISPFKYFLEAFMHTQFENVEYLSSDEGIQTTFNPLEELNLNFGLANCIIVLALLALALHMFAFILLKSLVKRITV